MQIKQTNYNVHTSGKWPNTLRRRRLSQIEGWCASLNYSSKSTFSQNKPSNIMASEALSSLCPHFGWMVSLNLSPTVWQQHLRACWRQSCHVSQLSKNITFVMQLSMFLSGFYLKKSHSYFSDIGSIIFKLELYFLLVVIKDFFNVRTFVFLNLQCQTQKITTLCFFFFWNCPVLSSYHW